MASVKPVCIRYVISPRVKESFLSRFIPERWLPKSDCGMGGAVKFKSMDGDDVNINLPTKGGTGFLPFSEGRCARYPVTIAL